MFVENVLLNIHIQIPELVQTDIFDKTMIKIKCIAVKYVYIMTEIQ